MRVGIVREFGGRECLRIEERGRPTVDADSVLIRLRAIGLNRADVIIREGRFPEAPVPIVLGVEGAGDVVECGDHVSSVRVGDRVVINPMLVCGTCPACIRGDDSACESLRIVGEHGDGTYADYIAVPARNAIRVPASIGYVDLAASVVAYMTAWHMLKTRARIEAGETLLVVGAGSGVGSAAIQVGRHLGARVLATSSTVDKARRLTELGADAVINYRSHPNFDAAVRDLTGGLGADVVHDSVGRATLQISINSLRHGGRLVGMGSHTGSLVELALWSIYRREITILGAHTSNAREIDELLPLIETGALTPIVDSVYDFEKMGDAHDRLVDGDRFGKVVLSTG